LMAEAFLQQTDPSLDVYSAVLNSDNHDDQIAIQVMNEVEIDTSNKKPKNIKLFEGTLVDYLITLCNKKEDKTLPTNILFKHKIHLQFDDPSMPTLFETENIETYREIRDEIRDEIRYFYARILMRELARELTIN
jgi:arsenate reductase (thioredoxin)